MAAPATPAKLGGLPEYGSLGYLKGCPEAFCRQADVRLVVEGRELPCHSQFLSRYCSVF